MPRLLDRDVSDHTFELNKHLITQPKAPKTKARQEIDAEAKKQFAATFEATWRLLGGPELEREYQFCPDRKWRADYVFRLKDRLGIEQKYIVELDGGVWTGGRHVRGGGYIADCMKINSAVLLGYRVIRIATGMATPAYLESLINAMR